MAEDRPAARTLAQGARLGGKYALVRRLATGGMGEVWLAQHDTTHANVALKVLRPKPGAKTEEAEERFRREARLAGLLTHRSIVRIFDFLEEPDGMLVLVMELLQGETLEHWVARRGALPEREAMAVIAAVLSALQHGHDQGIVHRDVKPSNIFLSVESDGRVIPKLLDYGIAKMPKNDAKTIDGVVLGTPSYMSPEQIRSEDDLDGRSDLFSCGVVLYEMLTGTCPFEAPTPSAAIAAVLQTSVDPDPRINPRLWLELQRALSKRPKQRHASAAEMRSAMLGVFGETEDSLAPVLQGVSARDYGAERSGHVAALSAALSADKAETQSVQGHSVGTVAPVRRLAGWWPWAAVGILAASVAMAMTVTHGARPSADAAAATAPPSITPVPASDPAPAPVMTTDVAPPMPAAPQTTSLTANIAHTTPAVAHPPHHKPRTPPKAVATSPGF